MTETGKDEEKVIVTGTDIENTTEILSLYKVVQFPCFDLGGRQKLLKDLQILEFPI